MRRFVAPRDCSGQDGGPDGARERSAIFLVHLPDTDSRASFGSGKRSGLYRDRNGGSARFRRSRAATAPPPGIALTMVFRDMNGRWVPPTLELAAAALRHARSCRSGALARSKGAAYPDQATRLDRGVRRFRRRGGGRSLRPTGRFAGCRRARSQSSRATRPPPRPNRDTLRGDEVVAPESVGHRRQPFAGARRAIRIVGHFPQRRARRCTHAHAAHAGGTNSVCYFAREWCRPCQGRTSSASGLMRAGRRGA